MYDVTEATLQMVCQTSSSGYYMNPIKMKKPEIIDLNLHYGDNFVLIHEALLDILQTKDSTGITMFHGPPGTGKTNYLRYLINEIKDKTIIYIPPDMINDVTRPNFLPFLMDYSNSILIIEDAESAILDRQLQNQFSTQAVSNLLNMSDGLIGDGVRQQIICTFNCDVQSIDPALRREGRLVLDYKFDRLKPENARRLCEKLDIPGHGKDINELTTLAQIYALKNAAKKRSTDNNDVNDMAAKIERLFEIKRQISNPCAHMFA